MARWSTLSAVFAGGLAACVQAEPGVMRPVVVNAPASERPATPIAASLSAERPRDAYLEMPRLYAAINAARAQHGAQPLKIDRGLALVAQQANASYLRLMQGQTQCLAGEPGKELAQRVANEAYAQLAAFSLSFQDVRALVVCVNHLEQAVSTMEAALDPALRFAGLDVAMSHGVDAGIAVVLTLGR